MVRHPVVVNLQKIPKCWGHGCITLGIGLTGDEDEFTDFVLKYVANNNDLEYGKDVKILTKNDPVKLVDYLNKYENKTQTAIIICTGPFKLPPNPVQNGIFDCRGNDTDYTVKMYSILVNSTLFSTLFSS